MKLKINLAAALALAVATSAVPALAKAPEPAAIIKHYAEVAHAKYEDSLITAKALDKAIDALLANPSDKTLKTAQAAWIKARVPYQQSEVYRFGNPIVDDWEGKVNSWPLDEGLIDYVDSSYGTESAENPLYAANIIANGKISHAGKTINAKTITWRTLRDLQEFGGIEANVATGYHAVEFLLWGQDLNGTGPGAGERPWTDYAKGSACTNAHCDRRAQYLHVATQLLVDDLAWMAKQWAPGGGARKVVTGGTPDAGLSVILTGLGSLSYGELAGERMKLGLMLHDPEEEQDCFSDNTVHSHYYNVIGMRNVWSGTYTRIDGRTVKGPSLSALVAKAAPDVGKEVDGKL
ncbi:imelysin family protein, partial [Rhizobium sp.]|uniref:imelysin family protein n=1 Tax=Rhizobium sp. TaxID=391 RepID=UPI002EF1D8F5